jgi:hypothetical protein
VESRPHLGGQDSTLSHFTRWPGPRDRGARNKAINSWMAVRGRRSSDLTGGAIQSRGTSCATCLGCGSIRGRHPASAKLGTAAMSVAWRPCPQEGIAPPDRCYPAVLLFDRVMLRVRSPWRIRAQHMHCVALGDRVERLRAGTSRGAPRNPVPSAGRTTWPGCVETSRA